MTPNPSFDVLQVAPGRWEHGSEYHLVGAEPHEALPEWSSRAHLYGSGRDALVALVLDGMARRGWSRLLFPSYYCLTVSERLSAVLPVASYEDGPLDAAPLWPAGVGPGDVVVTVPFFGARAPYCRADIPAGAAWIEDWTHDPVPGEGGTSEADWCFASLRKTLPVPDGGVVWSTSGQDLPDELEPTGVHRTAAAMKLSAMAAKRAYLEGTVGSTAGYRELAVGGESVLGTVTPAGESGISVWSRALLGQFPTASWRQQRVQNTSLFRDVVRLPPSVRMLDATPGTVLQGAVLVFDDPNHCARTRQRLIESRVYPAILWTQDGRTPDSPPIPERHEALGRQNLFLHCDGRYTGADLREVARLLARAL